MKRSKENARARAKFRDAIYTAKAMCYITKSKDPAGEKILEHMRVLADELQRHCDELLGESEGEDKGAHTENVSNEK